MQGEEEIQMLSRKKELGISLLIAVIPGIILPVAFFFLFSISTSATNRDIFPPLDNVPEIVGCLGVLIFAIPGYLTFILLVSLLNSAHDFGLLIPIFDAFPEATQGILIAIFCILMNLFFWTLAVSFFRQILKNRPVSR